jgi:hypothetical protein
LLMCDNHATSRSPVLEDTFPTALSVRVRCLRQMPSSRRCADPGPLAHPSIRDAQDSSHSRFLHAKTPVLEFSSAYRERDQAHMGRAKPSSNPAGSPYTARLGPTAT